MMGKEISILCEYFRLGALCRYGEEQYPHADLTAWERQIKLGENFYLPLSYGYETCGILLFSEKKIYRGRNTSGADRKI